jgi:hypothetical protein
METVAGQPAATRSTPVAAAGAEVVSDAASLPPHAASVMAAIAATPRSGLIFMVGVLLVVVSG